MNSNKLFRNVSTNLTTRPNGFHSSSTPIRHNDEVKLILNYALPSSCLAVILIVMITLSIRHRRRVLDKWHSLTRMQNTNPKYLENVGLRRDSEYETHVSHDLAKSSSANQGSSVPGERQYHLETIA